MSRPACGTTRSGSRRSRQRRQSPVLRIQPGFGSWTRPSGLRCGVLARRDDAAGSCPRGGATQPARRSAARSGASRSQPSGEICRGRNRRCSCGVASGGKRSTAESRFKSACVQTLEGLETVRGALLPFMAAGRNNSKRLAAVVRFGVLESHLLPRAADGFDLFATRERACAKPATVKVKTSALTRRAADTRRSPPSAREAT